MLVIRDIFIGENILKETKKSNRLSQIDGIKGYAILVIIASHTAAFGMHGQGSIWADFFFVLAGFFCVYPMLKDGEEKLSGIKSIILFYIKKLARIIPAYWFCIILFNLIKGTLLTDKRNIIRSMFLIQTSGHNWYVQHLMVGYFFIPLILCIIHFLKKHTPVKNWMIAIFLTAASLILDRWLLLKAPLYLLWNDGTHRVLFSGMVILGAAAGYIYKAVYHTSKPLPKPLKGIVSDIIEIGLILTLTVFTANKFLVLVNSKYENYIFGWNHPDICAILSALLIISAAVNTEGKICNMLFGNRVMVFLGKMSLEMYLIHYYMLDWFNINPALKFLLITSITIVSSYLLHTFVFNKIYLFIKKLIDYKKSPESD